MTFVELDEAMRNNGNRKGNTVFCGVFPKYSHRWIYLNPLS